MSSPYRQSLHDMIRKAREITHISLMLHSARSGVATMREAHDKRHWACEKTLSELECSHLNLVAQAQAFADMCEGLSDRAIWQYETCWWLLQSNWETVKDLDMNLKSLETEETKENVPDGIVAEADAEADDEAMNMLILEEFMLAIEDAE
ncbi:hypothetical protein G7Z17_g3207 [Cylindrodendrum hubeiense]|uniref:Uncharacterized protein n=1 Tax=Cylindrodendrum hubeiense TaxID=595255 RepID=A0A9P5HB99_9HYPO|nr:hypothetical protein G7Z17_g3207 [Cylindrodendrum hubeiense]